MAVATLDRLLTVYGMADDGFISDMLERHAFSVHFVDGEDFICPLPPIDPDRVCGCAGRNHIWIAHLGDTILDTSLIHELMHYVLEDMYDNADLQHVIFPDYWAIPAALRSVPCE